MNEATSSMVVVGRLATDVENEKKRIKDYFQGQVNRCQANFRHRYSKYAGRICE